VLEPPDFESEPELELEELLLAFLSDLLAGGDSSHGLTGRRGGDLGLGGSFFCWGLGLGGGDFDLPEELVVPDLEPLLWEPELERELELEPEGEVDLDLEELPELGLLQMLPEFSESMNEPLLTRSDGLPRMHAGSGK
jgi:hypothetical protein